MSNSDFIQRFVFDQLDVRGCYVCLEQTCEDIQQTHHYPDNLARLINQFAIAAVLMRDGIKLDASVTIQLRKMDSSTATNGLKLIMADCMSDRRVRAIAEYESDQMAAGEEFKLNDMGNQAVLAITITPDKGERYQSIVPLKFSSISECLQDYFARSEQLPSWFHLVSDTDKAIGIALHSLPAEKVSNPKQSSEHFQRLKMLLETLTDEEALSLDSTQTLTRLFHEESCRLFEQTQVEFGCICSADKSLAAIKSLGEGEVNSLIEEQKTEGKNNLVVDCHFCFQRYEFEFDQIDKLFN